MQSHAMPDKFLQHKSHLRQEEAILLLLIETLKRFIVIYCSMHHLKKVLKSVALQLKNDFQPTTDSHKPTFSTSIFHYGKQPLQHTRFGYFNFR